MPLLFIILHLKNRRDGTYKTQYAIFSSFGVIFSKIKRTDIK